jgi:uncharacterized membrane protein YccC
MEALIAKVNAFLAKLYIPCKVPADKQAHFLCGLVIAALLTPFIGAYSIVVVAIIALLKEIYDYLHKNIHTPDFWDWVATVLGGLVGFVIVALV